MEPRRRVDVVWIGDEEILDYRRFLLKCKDAGLPPGEFLKALLKRLV